MGRTKAIPGASFLNETVDGRTDPGDCLRTDQPDHYATHPGRLVFSLLLVTAIEPKI